MKGKFIKAYINSWIEFKGYMAVDMYMNKLIEWIASEKETCISKLTLPDISHSLKLEYVLMSKVYENILDFIKNNYPILPIGRNVTNSDCSNFLGPITNQIDELQKRLDTLEYEFKKKSECHHCLIKSRVDVDQWWCVICDNVIKMKIIDGVN